MDIPPVENTMRIVETASHRDHQQPPKRQQPRKRPNDKFVAGPVYKANGQLEDERPPHIDVLV